MKLLTSLENIIKELDKKIEQLFTKNIAIRCYLWCNLVSDSLNTCLKMRVIM